MSGHKQGNLKVQERGHWRKLGSVLCGGLVWLSACSAVYPEMKTSVRSAPASQRLEPGPPDDFYYFYFERAVLPAKTRDGRDWNPRAYAKLFVGGQEVLSTPIQAGTHEPTWPKQKRANYHITPEQEVVVEIWDAQIMSDTPICRQRVLHLYNLATGGRNELTCPNGARVWLGVEPARALLGLGFYYELRGSDGVRITRIAGQSPAERAGLRVGDRILKIQGEETKNLDALAVVSRINARASQGLQLLLLSPSGETREVSLQAGPIYPLWSEELKLPQEP